MSGKTIEDVFKAWEKRLMHIPGVQGVGISMTKNRQKKCIRVYVDGNASSKATPIPKEIEGYPVEIKIRGSFRSL